MKTPLFPAIMLCILLFATNCIAQGPQLSWAIHPLDSTYFGGDVTVESSSIDMVTQNFYVCGSFSGHCDFDLSTDTSILTNISIAPYIAKYDSAGNLIWNIMISGMPTGDGSILCSAIDSDGNICVGGKFSQTMDFDPAPTTFALTSNGAYDFFVAKYDANGNLLMAFSFGNMNNDGISAITTDTSDNIYVTGSYNYPVDFDPGSGVATLTTTTNNYDLFIAKYSETGIFLWVHSIGGSAAESATDLEVTNGNQLLLAGNFSGTCDFDPGTPVVSITSAGFTDVYIACYDLNGNFVWVIAQPGTSSADCIGIETDVADNIYLAGQWSGMCDFDPSVSSDSRTSAGNTDIYLSKFTSTGSYLWTKTIGSPVADYCNDIFVNNTGVIAITGHIMNNIDFDPSAASAWLVPSGNYDAYIASYDQNGMYATASCFGGAGLDKGKAIVRDASNNMIMSGEFNMTMDLDPSAGVFNITAGAQCQNVMIARHNSLGSFILGGVVGGYMLDYSYGVDGAEDVILDAKGNVYITGYSSGTLDYDPDTSDAWISGDATSDFFIAKYDSSGDYRWAISISGSQMLRGINLCMNNSGELIATGNFYGSADFDPSPGAAVLSGGGMFIAVYDTNGNYITAVNMVTSGLIIPSGITTDTAGSIYITGTINGTTDFDPSAAVVNLTCTNYHAFIAKYDANGNYLWANLIGSTGSEIWPTDLELDSAGNIFLTGYFNGTADYDPSSSQANLTSAGLSDVFVAAYDINGSYQWAKRFGGPGYDRASSIAYALNNDLLIVGSFEQTCDFDPGNGTLNFTSQGGADMFVSRFTSSGLLVWAHAMGGMNQFDLISDIFADTANTFYITGRTSIDCDFNWTAGTYHLARSMMFLARYEMDGDLMWASGFGSESMDYILAMDVATSGNIVVAGSFYYPTNFSTGTTPAWRTPNYGWDIFVARYSDACLHPTTSADTISACGPYTWLDGNTYTSSEYSATFVLQNMYGCDSTIFLALTIPVINTSISGAGNVMWVTQTGAVYQWIDCTTNSPIPGATSAQYTASTNGTYACIITLNNCSDTTTCRQVDVGINENSFLTAEIYPNPVTDYLIVQSAPGSSLIVYDCSGRIIISTIMNDESVQLNVSTLAAGAYHLKIEKDGYCRTQRFHKIN